MAGTESIVLASEMIAAMSMTPSTGSRLRMAKGTMMEAIVRLPTPGIIPRGPASTSASPSTSQNCGLVRKSAISGMLCERVSTPTSQSENRGLLTMGAGHGSRVMNGPGYWNFDSYVSTRSS